MSDTALAIYQFTIDAAISGWLEQKRTTRSGQVNPEGGPEHVAENDWVHRAAGMAAHFEAQDQG